MIKNAFVCALISTGALALPLTASAYTTGPYQMVAKTDSLGQINLFYTDSSNWLNLRTQPNWTQSMYYVNVGGLAIGSQSWANYPVLAIMDFGGTQLSMFENFMGNWGSPSYFGNGDAYPTQVAMTQQGTPGSPPIIFFPDATWVQYATISNGNFVPNYLYQPNGVTPQALQIAAVTNQDGRVEIFYIGTNQHLYHIWEQNAGQLNWSAESYIQSSSNSGSGYAANQIEAFRNPSGTLEVVYVGTNGVLYHNWQTSPGGGWNGETSFGLQASQIAIGKTSDGRPDVFYVGANAQLCHVFRATNSVWYYGCFTDRPGVRTTAIQIATATNSSSRGSTLQVFYRTDPTVDGGLYTRVENSAGSNSYGAQTLIE